MKKIFFIAIIILFSIIASAQDYHKIDSLKQILKTLPELDGTDTDTARIKVCLDIGDIYYYGYVPDSAIIWYSTVADTLYDAKTIKNFPKRAKYNATVLFYIGVVLNTKEDYHSAISYYNRSLKISEELGDKKGISNCLKNLGIISEIQGNSTIAISYYERSIKISEELGDMAGISRGLNNLGIAAFNQGDYSLAISYYTKSLNISEEIGEKIHTANCLNNLGNATMCQGDYLSSKFYYEKSLKLYEELGDIESISICSACLGDIALIQGNSSAATLYIEQALKIYEELGYKAKTTSLLNMLGIIADIQGNYLSAISYCERSVKIAEELDDKQSISYGLNSIGNACMSQGNYQSALFYYEQSLKIAEELSDYIAISGCLINLGQVYQVKEDYLKAIEFYQRGKVIAEEKDHKEFISNSLSNLGSVNISLGNYIMAKDYLEKCVRMQEELGHIEEIASNYSLLANVHILLQNPENALPLYRKSIEQTLLLMQNNFAILSEMEKELYLDQSKDFFKNMHSFNLKYGNQFDSISGLCYNNELVLKGLLLKSTATVMDVVYNSPDKEVKDTYFLLKQYRNQISFLQGSEENSRDSLISDLESKANEQERKLVRLSSEFADIQNLFSFKWQDVQKNLKSGEAAIEFVSFTQGLKNDTIVYAALLITPESTQPQSIKLFDENQLQAIIGANSETGFGFINGLYGTNKEFNESLYRIIWQALEQYLTGISTIYYAPVGVLNKVSFAALGNENGQFLCDKYNLHQLSTTGKLIAPKEAEKDIHYNAAVFGGIDYNSDSTKIINWKYLPGTLIEKESIEKQFKKNNITCLSFSGKEAKEENFKALFDSTDASSILHVSTHGFFYPDPEQVREEEKKTEKKDSGLIAFRGSDGFGIWIFVQNKNPMMRSGLVFAGANRVWSEDWGRTDNEGVLTAYEVSNMNMRNTDLVVLSACETGLGDIKGSEGVYGLQRAFKMAGVKYIIMSLWQVPDKETVEFMQTFYKKLLKIKDVRTAFTETQKEMRKKYDPYYWAAFVLIE